MTTTARRRATGDVPVPLQIDVPGFAVGPDDTVVDVGCGGGTVCAYAARVGAEVVGIDTCPEALARAEAAVRGLPARSWRGILSDCDPIPLPDGFASVVVATEVLEHVPDPARLLAEMVRVGRPGARYLISVPDPASESVLEAVAPGWYWEPPYHIHVYQHAALDALIRGAGLEPVARAGKGFHQALWWAFRFALGPKVDEPTPDHPVLTHWDAAWRALLGTPGGARAADALDRMIPRSQVVLARKPGEAGAGSASAAASSFRGPVWSRARWRRRVRDGGFRLGGFEVWWSVRRVRRDDGA